jgi:hypothetical protein
VTRRRLGLGLAAIVVLVSAAWALWPGDAGAARDINRLADLLAQKEPAAALTLLSPLSCEGESLEAVSQSQAASE